MLYRKIENTVKEKLSHSNEKILIVEGARQIGKSFKFLIAKNYDKFFVSKD